MTDATTRPFGLWTALALVVGGMIGSGIFVMPAAIAPYGWTGVVAWIVSMIGVVCIAYAIGRLSAAMPHATGTIAMTGAVLGPLPGLLVGWSYWISCWTSCAMMAIGGIAYLSVFVPQLSATPLAGAISATVLLTLLTLLNMRGARAAGRFQVVTTVLKLAPMAIVIVMVAGMGFAGSIAPPPMPDLPELGTGLTAATALAFLSFVGFEAAGIATGRVRDPARTIMVATMIGAIVVGLIYVVVSTGIVFALTPERTAASSAPVALFVETFWGHRPALFVAAFATISVVGALNCWVLIQGETPLGMARAGLLPAWFGRVSARDVPVGVLWVSSTLSMILILANGSKGLTAMFTFAALLTTSTALWLYIAICLAALKRGVAAMPAALGLAFTIWAMWGTGWYISLLGLTLTLTALPLYWLRPKAQITAEPTAAIT